MEAHRLAHAMNGEFQRKVPGRVGHDPARVATATTG